MLWLLPIALSVPSTTQSGPEVCNLTRPEGTSQIVGVFGRRGAEICSSTARQLVLQECHCTMETVHFLLDGAAVVFYSQTAPLCAAQCATK